MENLPVKGDAFSREEFDRIIRRASELQSGDVGASGSSEVIHEAELLRIGREVGLDVRHLRQAVGEARAEGLRPTPPPDRPLLVRLMGPGFLPSSRVVPGEAEAVYARLAEHLQEAEGLRRVRKRSERSLWEPADGVAAALRRTLRIGGGTYALARAGAVELSVARVEEGRSLVTIIADVRKIRGGTGLAAMAGLGLVVGSVGLGLGFAVGAPLLAIPGVIGGAGAGNFLGRHQFIKEADRIRLAMEGLLDRLEADEPLATRRDPPWKRRTHP